MGAQSEYAPATGVVGTWDQDQRTLRRYQLALEQLADKDNWCADVTDPPTERPPLMYGHFQPWELARRALNDETD